MRQALFVVALLALALAAIYAVGGGGLGVDGSPRGDRRTFWCPMDPEISRAGPGTCPICSMELVLFEEGTASGDPDVLQLTGRQVQQAGVRLATADVRPLAREIDTIGRLVPDPAHRSVLRMPFPGRSLVERAHVLTPGARLAAGDLVLEVTNPALERALAEYKVALRDYARARRAGGEAATAAAGTRMNDLKDRLVSYGLPAATVARLAARTPEPGEDTLFPVLARADGVVLAVGELYEGAELAEKERVLESAELARLLLYVDLYEHELPLVAPGQEVEFETRALPGETFRATLDEIEPLVQERTQTVRASARVENPNGELLPGLSVRARLACEVGDVLAVPESAVLASGRHDVVLVAEGGGRFRPCYVELGRRFLTSTDATDAPGERWHEVLSGVSAGELVVTAGNFLLNAEARFQGVLAKLETAAERARLPAPTPAEAEAFERVLTSYLELGGLLVLDRADGIALHAHALARVAADGADEAGVLAARFTALAEAARELAGAGETDAPDWDALRAHFASLSREVASVVRDHDPTRVSEGELAVFRCPMATGFGFELWLQQGAQLANPYMGQAMPECGVPASLD